VPAKFRAGLVNGCVLSRGLDGCLWLHPMEEWQKLAESVAALPITSKNARSFGRFILSGAMDLKIDRAGRINLPNYLADYAGMKTKIVITGMYNRLELWAENKWKEFENKMEENSEEVAEQLSSIQTTNQTN